MIPVILSVIAVAVIVNSIILTALFIEVRRARFGHRYESISYQPQLDNKSSVWSSVSCQGVSRGQTDGK